MLVTLASAAKSSPPASVKAEPKPERRVMMNERLAARFYTRIVRKVAAEKRQPAGFGPLTGV